MMKNEKKNFFEWKYVIEGLWLGATLLAPGLSMATVAMVLGFYEKLLDTISEFFSSNWKNALRTLIPLGLGALIALFISSRVISLAYDNFTTQTYFFFLGLSVGTIPLLLKSAESKKRFKGKHYLALVISAVLVLLLFMNEPESSAYVGQIDAQMFGRLLLTGAIASSAMLLPGLSAALVLLLLGTHSMLTHAVSSLNLPVILIVVLGAGIGMVATSKAVKFLLKNYMDMTYAVSIGMVIGSVIVIYPGISFANPLLLLVNVFVFLVGLSGVLLLNRKKTLSGRKMPKSLKE